MKKLLGGLISLLLLTIVATVLTVTYKNLKPQKQITHAPRTMALNNHSEEIDFKNLESDLLNEDGTYYLWFCDTEDDNCTYVENEFIAPMLKTLKIDQFKNMYKVNFTDCPFSKQRLLEKYNVDSTLAFVKVEVLGSHITYSDGITWTKDKNFSFEDLQNWLYEHNIWQQSYESLTKNSN